MHFNKFNYNLFQIVLFKFDKLKLKLYLQWNSINDTNFAIKYKYIIY